MFLKQTGTMFLNYTGIQIFNDVFLGGATEVVYTELLQKAFGVLGNITSFALYLSPVPTFYRIRKKGSVEDFSPTPYLATLMNCMLWTLYGLPVVHPNSLLVLTTNGTGTIIEICFVLLFLFYSNGKKRLLVFVAVLAELSLVTVIGLLVLTCTHSYAQRSTIVGILCVFLTILMYAAPLEIMKTVIQTGSVEYMPLSMSLAFLANALCWTLYAFPRYDIFIMTPHCIGMTLAIVQLILYAKYSAQGLSRQKLEMLTDDSQTEDGSKESLIQDNCIRSSSSVSLA